MIAEPLPDFERLRLSTRPLDALAARPSNPPRHRQGEAFLKGPIPMAWLALAARLPGRALHMGLVLWYWAGITKRRVVAPSLSRAIRCSSYLPATTAAAGARWLATRRAVADPYPELRARARQSRAPRCSRRIHPTAPGRCSGDHHEVLFIDPILETSAEFSTDPDDDK